VGVPHSCNNLMENSSFGIFKKQTNSCLIEILKKFWWETGRYIPSHVSDYY
jgi:hypothetical protein